MIMKRICVAFLAAALFLPATVAYAKDAGDILIRVRGIGVVPDESGTTDALGGSIEIDNAYVPELDFTYFFTENIAAELILATAKHDVTLKNPNVDLGSVWLLPPTLTLQYHFLPKSRVSPYLGAGVNYTIFYNEKSGGVNDISYDNSFGLALQAGVDVMVDDAWSVNFDVKKIFLNTDVSVNGGAVNADVDIDPWIFGIGVGYRF